MKLKKPVSTFFKRLFHVKKIIVVTDHAVDYYPMGKGVQILAVAGVLGFVSWASYSTGSFMAATSQIEEKNRKIEVVSSENRKIEGQFSLLKRDLVRLQDEGKELSDYTKFVITQYEEGRDNSAGKTDVAYGAELAENQSLIMERIEFLEDRIERLKVENESFVEAIRQRTRSKIDEFEDIINMTGLSSQALELKQSALESEEEEKASASAATGGKSDAKGGPYIPESTQEVVGREKKLFDEIDQMMVLHGVVDKLPLTQPLKGKYTSGFGRRLDPFTRRLALHTGLDIAGPIGARVHATNDGVVSFSGRKGAYGNMVDIEHGLGVSTRYGHLSKILVKDGQKIRAGDIIGIQGSTGRSTGNHVHYEVRYNDTPLNPKNFIKAGQHVSSLN